ncbi:MAG: type VI secretion system baseplate subunit TssG [Candidatus Zixiibacteriota bacterium]|nr:MAG: type VI secretion system baseplate subunit TssG [candidate division Zixibacteria bacterium]
MTGYPNNTMPVFCNRRFPFHYITAINTLMKMGVNPHFIDIIAVGEYENYKGEVREQMPPGGTVLEKNTKIMLKVGYPSAVDVLPYQFFYGFEGITERSDEWDELSRRLMAPFDASVVRYGAVAHYQTLRHNFGVLDRAQLIRFLNLYGFTPPQVESWDLDELVTWATLMPSFHFWAGNTRLIEMALRFLFGFDFKIIENVRSEHAIPEELEYRLGMRAGRLGCETIVGRSFAEWDSFCKVQVGNIDPQHLSELFPGKPLRARLDWVLELCMPGGLLYCIDLMCVPGKSYLGGDQKSACLGYAARI